MIGGSVARLVALGTVLMSMVACAPGQDEADQLSLPAEDVAETSQLPLPTLHHVHINSVAPERSIAWYDYRGHRESYLSEIAAYELDKLLELGMTPPTVEKRIERDVGAAVMWVAPAQSFSDLGGPPSPPSTRIGWWNYQLICAKMFHNLIFNKDPNLGNWLVDPAWNLILIDNSRAFTTGTQMVHKLTRVDQDLWDRFLALDEPTLTTAVSEWLDDGQIRAILARRDRMAEDIEEMVAERGRASMFVHFREVSDAPRRADPDADTEVDL